MPYRIEWMTGVDDTILQWFSANDVIVLPKILCDNMERDLGEGEAPSYSHVSRRCRVLRKAGLLELWKGDRGKYHLSDMGREFLEDPGTHYEELSQLDADSLSED